MRRAPAGRSPRPRRPPEVQQDTALGKVTVRARNRLEPLQEVPLSISVVTGKELDRLQATEIGAITQRAANVSWNLGNQRTSSLSIRGVGRQGQTEAQDPSVGFIVDGVSYGYNALTSSFDFIDVDTVEVTRGPQGTLLGKNASLGVVSVTTRRPSFTPDASCSVTYGDWDTVIVRGAGGGPIIDGKLAWRVAFNANKGQGDIKNEYNRDITWTNKDRVYGRAQLLFTPTDNFSARLSVDAQPRGGETTNAPHLQHADADRSTPTARPNTLATDCVDAPRAPLVHAAGQLQLPGRLPLRRRRQRSQQRQRASAGHRHQRRVAELNWNVRGSI